MLQTRAARLVVRILEHVEVLAHRWARPGAAELALRAELEAQIHRAALAEVDAGNARRDRDRAVDLARAAGVDIGTGRRAGELTIGPGYAVGPIANLAAGLASALEGAERGCTLEQLDEQPGDGDEVPPFLGCKR